MSIFETTIETAPPLSIFPRKRSHPVSSKAVFNPYGYPIPTNKWYSNLFLGGQTDGVWTLPYMLWVHKDPRSYGLAVSHVEEDKFTLGPDPNKDPVQYYFSPIGIRSMQLGALELHGNTTITLDGVTNHAVNLHLNANNGSITFPLTQGMGFVTGQYNHLTPTIDSGVMYRQLIPCHPPRHGIQKWKVILEDGHVWLIYAFGSGPLDLVCANNGRIQARSGPYSGVIQITKVGEGNDAERTLDDTAGAFVTEVTLAGGLDFNYYIGNYSFHFGVTGENNAGAPLMYALPHHVDSFLPDTAARRRHLWLRSTTKGVMTAVVSSTWYLSEQVPAWIGWHAGPREIMTATALAKIKEVVEQEVRQDVEGQSNLDSMYFAGKALAKYAQIALVAADIVADHALAKQALEKLICAMSRFTENRQKFKLVYDEEWKGLCSEASWATGDPGIDFGNSYYNDHHFHYGYFIYTAAAIVRLQRTLHNSTTWLTANRAYVNTLVRDTANPPHGHQDPHFPPMRAFDFFHGHSWAKGLFPSADGKDQESSSEDTNFAYALHLWGTESGQLQVRDLGLLMLGILRGAMNSYFLMDGRTKTGNHPKRFLGNYVTGILFENKVDHATYFGMNREYIHGIHMLPTTPISKWIRRDSWAREEWESCFGNGAVDAVQGGWRGILWASRACWDPRGAWGFFAGESGRWTDEWLDGGLSRAWGLALAAGEF
ncbi:endo-1,3(4)-beta-glucanase [Kalaharituber pfeilii]|nr:endo-1,3(4)-beta-glucanase [Kalaharituber pfeilii]